MEAKGTKDTQNQALLLHCAGQDVQDIFVTLSDTGPAPDGETQYAKATRLLDVHFLPQVNIPFERHQFRQAKQEESETTDQFVTRLFQLSENCDFGTSKEEQIRDQLIDKCRSHDLHKKLLAASGKLTLQKARDIARSICMEAAESQARSIESNSRSGNVNSLEREYFDSPKRGGGRCYRCGLAGHFARDPECKARLATCMKCKKVGHFTNVCKMKEEDTNRPKKGNIHQVTKDDDFTFTLQSSGRDIPTTDIELGGVRLEGVLVDSGSTCNVIDRATWETLKEKKVKCVSTKSKRKLYSYGSNEPLTTAGEFETELRYKDKRCHVCFIVVEEKARAILCTETSEELAILKLEINAIKEETLLRDFPECFKGVGKLKGFQAKLHIDGSVKPVAQTL